VRARAIDVVEASLALTCMLALTCALVLACTLAVPARVRAHPAELGAIHVRETEPGRFSTRFEYSGNEASPRGASLVWPEGCALEGPVERVDRPFGESQRAIVRCSDAALARDVVITSLPTDIDVAVHVERLDHAPRDLLLDASLPRFTLAEAAAGLDTQGSVARFVALGLEHIATGFDHLAFVALLVLVARRRSPERAPPRALVRGLVVTLTAFTLAHATTLALAVTDVLTLPSAPVEVCIALSVLLLAAEVARVEKGRAADTLVFAHLPWVAGLFGLVHGLGFAGALRDAGLREGSLALSLASFHVGIELGQLAFVLGVVALLHGVEPRAWASRTRLSTAYGTGVAAAFWALSRLGL
jgi:hypothetical protein